MLPVGIGVMVASVVLGVIALALVAVTSSTVRSAGRSTRTAMGLSAREEDAFAEDPSGEGAYDPAATDLHHSVEDEQPYYPREPDPPPPRGGGGRCAASGPRDGDPLRGRPRARPAPGDGRGSRDRQKATVKLAIAGKGGAGKTSITGTLARMLARRGGRVLAIDNDLNPNLSLTLGIPAERISGLPTFPAEIVRRNDDGVYELAMSLAQIFDRSSVAAPDGVSLLVAAEPTEAATGCMGSAHMAVRGVIGAAPSGEEDFCIVDLEASTEHLLVATAEHADAMYAVVEAYGTSLETGRRVAVLARDLGLPRVGLILAAFGQHRALGSGPHLWRGLGRIGQLPHQAPLPALHGSDELAIRSLRGRSCAENAEGGIDVEGDTDGCGAAREMEVGPPRSPCRGRSQTTARCAGQEPGC